MESENFLTSADRHDLFEKIKKVNPASRVSDNSVQDLLDAVEKKHCSVHAKVWGDITTVSFAGRNASELRDAVLRMDMSGFCVVEACSRKGYYLRYRNIDESIPQMVCGKCGGLLGIVKNGFTVCKECDQEWGVGPHIADG